MKKLTDKQKHENKIKIAREFTKKLKLTKKDGTKIFSFANTKLFLTDKWQERKEAIQNRIKKKNENKKR
jgi:S-adenosylmethionine:tRNA-ribosyltransferase-isomerase (queuine synthetase)